MSAFQDNSSVVPQPLPAVCAVMVTYNPDGSLEDNIRALLPQVKKIIVVDNGSSLPGHEQVATLASFSGIEIIWNDHNLGIAAALNEGIRQAVVRGFSWVVTFDQDSRVSPGFIRSIWEAYAVCPFRERVAIVGPHYTTWEIEEPADPAETREIVSLYKEVRTTMTSGNLVNAGIFFRCGMFDESFFIDYVDHEFCLRARKHGFIILEAVLAHLAHRLGNRAVHQAFGRSFTVTHHSAARRYYSTRNRLRTYSRFLFFEPVWVISDASGLLKETVKLVLFEKNRMRKLISMVRGIADALLGRSGPHPFSPKKQHL